MCVYVCVNANRQARVGGGRACSPLSLAALALRPRVRNGDETPPSFTFTPAAFTFTPAAAAALALVAGWAMPPAALCPCAGRWHKLDA